MKTIKQQSLPAAGSPDMGSLEDRVSAKLKKSLQALAVLICLAALSLPAQAQKGKGLLIPRNDGVEAPAELSGQLPGPLRNVGIDQHLNQQIPLELTFRDETGRQVQLRDYFEKRAVILALVYYECPMLCTQVMNGLVSGLKPVSLDPGSDYGVVFVSINPAETPDLAAAKKQGYVEDFKRKGAAEGFHFLVGDESSIKPLADAVGFHYTYDEKSRQYVHASGVMILTPEGRLSRYFYGIEYAPRDLRLGLVEASARKIGNPTDKLLLYCYHYDPSTGRYGPVIMNMLRLGGLATFLGVAAIVAVYKRKMKKKGAGRKAAGLTAACLALFPLFPDQASTVAERVDHLYFFLIGVAVFFSALIVVLILYFMLKYRRRSESEVGVPIEGSTRLEIFWTAVPFVIAMGLFAWGASVYFTMYRQPRDGMEIYVVGKQWMWKFQHPEGAREINELHVPVGTNVKLTMTTEDVIHSFYVPDFRIKADVVPGKYTSIWFNAVKTGRFHLFCAEYCGTNHSGMIGWIEVMEKADYEAWLAGGPATGNMAQEGEKLFQDLGCASCHRSDAQGRGPVLTGLFGKPVSLEGGQVVTADEAYIRESILNPRAKIVSGFTPIMPTFQGIVSEEQLLALIAYVKSLNAPAAPGTGGAVTPAQVPQQGVQSTSPSTGATGASSGGGTQQGTQSPRQGQGK